MITTVSTTTNRLPHKTLTLTLIYHRQIRHFAKWTPYKPPPKPKLHQNLKSIKTLKTHLQNSYFVSPFPTHGFSANKFKPLKSAIKSHPSSKLVFVKNKLVSKAVSGTQFEELGFCMKGMNSMLFVEREGEEDVGSVMGSVKSAVKDVKMEFNDFNGGVVDGKMYGFLDLEVLRSGVEKVERNGMVLGSVFGPSSSLMAVLEGFCGDECGGDGGGEGEDGKGDGKSETIDQ